MGLSTFDAIEKFKTILDFMGFKTMQTVAKLQRPKELDHFIIETTKLKTNMKFQEKYSGINLDLGHGDILLLKDIASASFTSLEHDKINIQKNIFEKCVKVTRSFAQQISIHIINLVIFCSLQQTWCFRMLSLI